MDLELPTTGLQRTEPASPKRAQVERDVLQAVDDLLRDGQRWNDLSIERIATSAGISRTAFYFYFRDKRELLMRLVGDVGQEVYEASVWLNGSGGDGREVIVGAMRDIGALHEQHGVLLQAVSEVAAVDATVADFDRELTDRFVEATTARIGSLRAKGEGEPVLPIEATAHALVTMTRQAFYEWGVRGTPITEKHADALSEIWIRAVFGAD
ncbi:MAG: TetR/AcrR family transcriptional regulator [Solirubrobacteraceae bacterium]|nr:TetR/AcrR family transcriptional regulator [Solirubrobacteraceae bacterium]